MSILEKIIINIKWIGKYLISWIIWMLLSRLVFGLYNLIYHQHISTGDFFKSFLYGSYMDLSIVGYLFVLILLLLCLFHFTRYQLFLKTIKWFTIIILIVFSFLNATDSVLYKEWGYKLDATPLFYINKAGEALNFISLINMFSAIAIFTLLMAFGIYLFNKISLKNISSIKSYYVNGLISFLLIPLMIIPIRGGIGLAPMNLSKVYFSNNIFSNHMAVNTVWNILYSITEASDLKSKFDLMPDKEASGIVAQIFKDSDDSTEMILTTKNPNILFIILESFTGKVIDYKLNGIEVTPNLNKWSKEELYFSNMYASAD
ncbi:MAG TPA: hypothetical protein VK590_11230, partial [Saprospiraceae bacterium]|nr:hypothetical protein [Saprospiraceae bacterium]